MDEQLIPADVERGAIDQTEADFLAGYDPHTFPCFAVAVDVVLITIRQGRLAVLLVERGDHPYRGAWALPGGFVGSEEDIESAAWRTLRRETGARVERESTHLEQLATYGGPARDPRMRVVSVAYLALLPDRAALGAHPRGGQVRFWPLDDLEGEDAPPLAFDHAAIIRDGVERARGKLEYTTVALSFVDEPFTLADLRRVYETVWGVGLDPSNFRRKVLDTPGFVAPLDDMGRRNQGGGRGRPGELYRKGPAYRLTHILPRPPTGKRDA